ncbi:MAG: 30S ribosomal protein S6 [Bdellovibrionales bacterium]|nr:30S ribosomal protein S6 [Bdellovibrionales bacterium]
MAISRPAIRTYELVCVLNASLDEGAVRAEIGKIQTLCSEHNGSVSQAEIWGKRQLAYPIQDEKLGIYVVIVFDGDTSLVAALDRQLRINDSALRHLIVVKDKFAPDLSPRVKDQCTPLNESMGRPSRGEYRGSSRRGGSDDDDSRDNDDSNDDSMEEASA